MIKRREPIVIEHINIHELVSFKMFILEANGKEEIELILVTNQDSIYKTSDNSIVLKPPRNISLRFNDENLFSFIEVLIKSSSTYFENQENEVLEDTDLTLGDAKIKLRKPWNENSRYKLILDVYRDDGEQLLSLNISKTRIILLLQMFKETYEKYAKNKNIVTKVKSNNFVFSIVRNEHVIGIRNIWFRNTEIIILKYVINNLIFAHNFGKDEMDFKNYYRQIMIYKNKMSDSINVSIKKINKSKENFHFVLTSKIAAVFYLLITDIDNFDGDTIDEY